MATPNKSPAVEPSNSKLFYDSLIQGLLRPDVRYSDAHYLNFALPRDDGFEGASGWVSNYLDLRLAAALDLQAQRIQELAKRREAGERGLSPHTGLTEEDRRNFLEQGVACLTIQMVTTAGAEPSWTVARPMDFRPDEVLLESVIGDAEGAVIANSPEPFVYDSLRREYIPDPFTDPHLLALYKYLQQ